MWRYPHRVPGRCNGQVEPAADIPRCGVPHGVGGNLADHQQQIVQARPRIAQHPPHELAGLADRPCLAGKPVGGQDGQRLSLHDRCHHMPGSHAGPP